MRCRAGRKNALFTIGHSTRPIKEFIGILRSFGITEVADVRTIPASRHNPQYNRLALQRSLAEEGIGYTHMADLGGLRKAGACSPNTGWMNRSFRGYADYMQTEAFDRGIARLLKAAKGRKTVVMCAEAVPWRCHRSLIADALLARGKAVCDITAARQAREHMLTPFALVSGTRVTYPGTGQRREGEDDKNSSIRKYPFCQGKGRPRFV